jgi:hypothetical protein
MRWPELVVLVGEVRGAYRDLVWKSEQKRPLGITSHRWEDNIKIGLHVVGWGSHGLDLSGS